MMDHNHDDIAKALDETLLKQLKEGTVVTAKDGAPVTIDPPPGLLSAAIKRLQQVGATKKTENTDPISEEMRKRMRLVGQQRRTG